MKTNKMAGSSAVWILLLGFGLLGGISNAGASDTAAGNFCDRITVETAAKILLVPVTDLQKSSRDLMVSPEDVKNNIYQQPPYSCSIRSKSDFLKVITTVTYVYADPSLARLEFSKMKQGFETVSKVDRIQGMGQDAFWAGDSRFLRLVAVKDVYVIDIIGPKKFDDQVKIMRMILDK